MNHRARWTDPNHLWKFVLGAAGVLYIVCLPSSYVGHFIDDATYVLAAKSLLQGRYVLLYHPTLPPLTQYPPGYPIFLMPFMMLFGSNFLLFKLTSLALVLMSALVLWKFLEQVFSPWPRLIACSLYLFNPITLLLSNAVMSEPLYAFLSLLSFWLLQKVIEKRTPGWLSSILGLTLGWASIVRTAGLLLVPSIAMGLARSSRRQLLLRVLPIALLPGLGFFIRNRCLTGSSSSHMNLMNDFLAYIWHHPGLPWLDHLHRVGYIFFVYVLAGLRMPHEGWGIVASVPLLLMMLAITGWGLRSIFSRGALPKPLLEALALYVLSYLILHFIWLFIDSRFGFQLLPFLVTGMVEGGRLISLRSRRPVLVASVLIGLVSVSYGYHDVIHLHKTYARQTTASESYPQTTFTWIQQHVPETAVFLYVKAPTLYLYTGRKGIPNIQVSSGEELRETLRRKGVTHLLYQTLRLNNSRAAPSFEERLMGWISQRRDLYPMLYSNPDERTILFEVARNRIPQ